MGWFTKSTMQAELQNMPFVLTIAPVPTRMMCMCIFSATPASKRIAFHILAFLNTISRKSFSPLTVTL